MARYWKSGRNLVSCRYPSINTLSSKTESWEETVTALTARVTSLESRLAIVESQYAYLYALNGSGGAAPTLGSPSITTDGTPQVGETLIGVDGTVTNLGSNTLSRRWLLGSMVLATTTNYIPTVTGVHTYQNRVLALDGVTVLATASATVNVAAATVPVPSLSFTNPTATVTEGNSGTQTVTNTINIVRNGLTGDVVVALAYSGTAAAGTDYVASPTSVTIASGSNSATFSTTINGDTSPEGDETVIITASLAGYSATAVKTITITNDDADPATAPVLTRTTAAGTNPMRWSSAYTNMIADSDYIACRWRSPSGGGAWTYETEHLFTSDDFQDSEDGNLVIAWPKYNANTFGSGLTVEVQEGVHRGTDAVVWSDSLIDTMVDAAVIMLGPSFYSSDLAAEGYPSTLTKTFTFPAGTRGFVVHAEEAAISATIAGIAAVKRVELNSSQSKKASLWTVPPEVSASGSYTVAITFAAAIGKVGLQTFTGPNTGTIAATRTSDDVVGTNMTSSLPVPATGVGAAFAFGHFANDFSWSNAVKLSSNKINIGGDPYASSFAKVTVAGAPTATPDAGYCAIIAVAFNHS